MKKEMIAAVLALSFCLLPIAAHAAAQTADDASFITKDELKAILGNTDMTLIDMRFGRDWTDATLKIKGAVREDPMKPGMWIDNYPKDRMLVFY